MIPAIIAGAAGVISGIGGSLINSGATERANKRAFLQQKQLNEQQHHLNSFANLRRNAETAGLNPYLAMQGATGTSSSSSAPDVIPNTAVGDAISNMAAHFSSVMKTFAETERINADAKGKEIENTYASSTLQDKVKIWELQRKIDEKRDYILGIDKNYHGLMRANDYAFSEYRNSTQRYVSLNMGLEYQYNAMFGEDRNRLQLSNMKAIYDKTLSDIDLQSLTMDEVVSRTHLNKTQAYQIMQMLPYLQAESKSRTFANHCAGMLSNTYSKLNDFDYGFKQDVRADKVQQEKNETYGSYWRGQDSKFSSKLKKFDFDKADLRFGFELGEKATNMVGQGVDIFTSFGRGSGLKSFKKFRY